MLAGAHVAALLAAAAVAGDVSAGMFATRATPPMPTLPPQGYTPSRPSRYRERRTFYGIPSRYGAGQRRRKGTFR